MKNILLLYISEVSGHHQASLAVEDALRRLEPSVNIRNINSFNYISPTLERVINRAYMGVINRAPEVWDFLYDNPKVVKNTKKLRDAIHKFNSKRFKTLLDGFKPDAVACTQAFPCGMVADYKKSTGADIPLLGILTDYAPHSYWVYDDVDYYIVPSIDTGKKIVDKGVDERKVKPLGIPINPLFLQPVNRASVQRKYGLNPSLPTALVMGGGQGLGPIKKLISLLDKSQGDFQMIVVAGTNKKLYTRLKKKANKMRKKVVILEFVDNVHELMEVSSLLVTKPGGITTAEALAKQLPMVIIKALPGQEAMNAEFLLQEKVAVKSRDVHDASRLISRLLADRERLSMMREAARRHGLPNSAFETARLMLDLAR